MSDTPRKKQTWLKEPLRRPRIPILDTIVVLLALDRLKPPGWVVGAILTLWALLAITWTFWSFSGSNVRVKPEALEPCE